MNGGAGPQADRTGGCSGLVRRRCSPARTAAAAAVLTASLHIHRNRERAESSERPAILREPHTPGARPAEHLQIHRLSCLHKHPRAARQRTRSYIMRTSNAVESTATTPTLCVSCLVITRQFSETVFSEKLYIDAYVYVPDKAKTEQKATTHAPTSLEVRRRGVDAVLPKLLFCCYGPPKCRNLLQTCCGGRERQSHIYTVPDGATCTHGGAVRVCNRICVSEIIEATETATSVTPITINIGAASTSTTQS